MAEPKPRVFEFAASYDGAGRITAKDESTIVPEAWAPEHLVLGALVDCSLTSLRYHAERAGVEDVTAHGEASGIVTRRDSDGRFAFVDIEVTLTVKLTPPPDDIPALLAKAERDCFVGASLTAKPHYTWEVT